MMYNRIPKYPLFNQGGRISPFESQYISFNDPRQGEMLQNTLVNMQNRHDQVVANKAQQIAEMGNMPTHDPEFIQEQITRYKDDLGNTLKRFGNNYAYAATALSERMGNEAANPVWKLNRQQYEQGQIHQKFMLERGPGNTIVLNDPTAPGKLREAVESGDVSKITANVVARDNYDLIIQDLSKFLTEEQVQGLLQKYKGDPEVRGMLENTTSVIINEDTRRRLAQDLLNTFKGIARSINYEGQAEGGLDPNYAWTQDDEAIIERMVQAWSHRDIDRKTTNYMRDDVYMANLSFGHQRQLAKDNFDRQLKLIEAQQANPPNMPTPPSGFDTKGTAVVQGMFPEVDSTEKLINLAKEEGPGSAAEGALQNLVDEVLISGKLGTGEEFFKKLTTEVLPSMDIFKNLSSTKKMDIIRKIDELPKMILSEGTLENIITRVFDEVDPNILHIPATRYRGRYINRDPKDQKRSLTSDKNFFALNSQYLGMQSRFAKEINESIKNYTEKSDILTANEAGRTAVSNAFRANNTTDKAIEPFVVIGKDKNTKDDQKFVNKMITHKNEFDMSIIPGAANRPAQIFAKHLGDGRERTFIVRGNEGLRALYQIAVDSNNSLPYLQQLSYETNQSLPHIFNSEADLKEVKGALPLHKAVPHFPENELLFTRDGKKMVGSSNDFYVARLDAENFGIVRYDADSNNPWKLIDVSEGLSTVPRANIGQLIDRFTNQVIIGSTGMGVSVTDKIAERQQSVLSTKRQQSGYWGNILGTPGQGFGAINEYE